MRVGVVGKGGSTCPTPRLTQRGRGVSWADGSGGRDRKKAHPERLVGGPLSGPAPEGLGGDPEGQPRFL